MARTRAQTAAQKGLPSLASNDQGKRPQGNQLRKSGSPKRGRFQEQHATERAERNRPSPPTISKTPSRQDSPAPAQSRGRKRKRSIENVLVPSPDPDPKRQRTSPTRPAGNTIDELLSRKRGVDGPAESNLPRAKLLRKAKALEHASQERAISDHADFYSSQEVRRAFLC
ncbi:hypothetical protein F5883DRAFT_654815 [Diaporthe sp. PMI_573]|nr:hypothetical protein F5883DRAFT_654815 [Diaporthaceae sp. PMI_573]